MGKHTEGPWTPIEKGHRTPGCGEHPHIVAADGTVVMDGEWYSSVPNPDNARLFAAAPDLLDALEGYMDAVQLMNSAMKDGGNVHGAISNLIGCEDNARQAIARARGEA